MDLVIVDALDLAGGHAVSCMKNIKEWNMEQKPMLFAISGVKKLGKTIFDYKIDPDFDRKKGVKGSYDQA